MNTLRKMNAALLLGVRMPIVFNPGNAGWKLAADGKTIEMKDGNPIWINADGSEAVLQQDAITRLNNEAAGHRRDKEAMQAQLDKFKGIDPEKARSSIEIADKIDKKKLIDAGEVDKVRNEIKTEFEAKLSESEKARLALASDFDNLRIDNVFNNSQFVKDRVAVPQDMFQSYFRSNFKIGSDGKAIEAYGKDGNRIMSKQKIGEYADADEALAIMVEQHPQKDVILRANNNSGSGNNGGGGHRPGQRTVSRSEFEKLPPHEQAAVSGKARTGEVVLTD